MKQLIEKIIATPGPSGYEKQIREVIRAEVEPDADEIKVDALGNLIVRKGEKSEKGLRVMVAAHMDEIGVIATHVDENGFVRFSNLGGVFPSHLPGGRVRFLNGTSGVIYTESSKDWHTVPDLSKMYIDVGATSPKDCPVKIGDAAVFDRPFEDLGNRVIAKAMDDRIGCVLLIETLRKLKKTPHEIYFVFTVQEEVGVRGATTSAYSIDPDVGLAVDITPTGDTPKGREMDVALGKGPAIKVKDSGMIADPRVVEWMSKTAEKSKIPYQYEVLLHGGTDARAMQLTRGGVPAGCLSIPTRYAHSPSEMIDMTDVEQSLQLLIDLLSSPVPF